MSTITERVERGTALLDEKRPGWWREIDLAQLDIESPCNCVIGQVAGATSTAGYLAMVRDLDIKGAAEVAFGFEADDDADWLAEEYAALGEAWRDLITLRREQAAVTA